MTTIALPATRDHKDARNDRLFRYVLVATVVFVLLALAGAALSMLWGGRHALEASGLDFFFTARSEEHTSELQSLMRISYAVFCLKHKKKTKAKHTSNE